MKNVSNTSIVTPVPWWNVNMGPEAEAAVAKAVRNRMLSMGKLTLEFEERIAERLCVAHAVATTNGTTALILALLEAGVGPGDEVIVPDITWIATAHAAYLLGAKAVLVDIEKNLPVLDPAAFKKAITPRTKVVIPVHLNGKACNMPAIRDLAEQNNIIVIEDASQAFLSQSPEGGYLGTHSRCGCFSLSVTKLITSGQGGFIVTNSDKIAKRLRLMRTQGTNDIIEACWEVPGGNFRFSDILAALALSQLEIIETRMKGLIETYTKYTKSIVENKEFHLTKFNIKSGELPLYIEAHCTRRNDLVAVLHNNNIHVRQIYPGLHTAKYFSQQKCDYPNGDSIATCGLFLPSGPDRTDEEINRVASVINEWTSV